MSAQVTSEPGDEDELARLRAEFDQLWGDLQRWQLMWGPLRIRARLGSQRLAATFMAFHGLTAVTGIVFIFVGASFTELGVALVVGSLFGFGAFLAQVWVTQSEREKAVVLDDYRVRFVELGRRWDGLMARLESNQESA